jgi:hypothetical protein
MKFKRFINNEAVSNEPLEVTIGNLAPEQKAVEAIQMDVELFIRVLEYAHENAKTDQELHELTERAAAKSRDKILTMEDYEGLVAELRREPDDPNEASPKEYKTLKTDPAFDSDKPTDPQKFGGGALSGM